MFVTHDSRCDQYKVNFLGVRKRRTDRKPSNEECAQCAGDKCGTGFYRFWLKRPKMRNGAVVDGTRENFVGSNCTWERPDLDIAPGTCVEIVESRVADKAHEWVETNTGWTIKED